MMSCSIDSSVRDGLSAGFISSQTTPSTDEVKRDRSAFEVLVGIDSSNGRPGDANVNLHLDLPGARIANQR
jgi:hypothetical protein